MFDYVLMGQYPSEADIAATKLGQSTAPIGTPRTIESVPLPGSSIDGSTASLAPLTPAAVPVSASAPAPAASAATAKPRVALNSTGAAAEPKRVFR